MPDPKPRKIKQYAPVKFGEPFNPKSVEGAQMRRRQVAAIRMRKEEEMELAEIDARQDAENVRLVTRSPFRKLWDRIFGNDRES